MERLESYHTHNSQFCKRILDYLTIMFTAQVCPGLGLCYGGAEEACSPKCSWATSTAYFGTTVVSASCHIPRWSSTWADTLVSCSTSRRWTRRYMRSSALYVLGVCSRDVSLCILQAYFSAASELHSTQVRALLNGYLATIKKASEDEQDQGKCRVVDTSLLY